MKRPAGLAFVLALVFLLPARAERLADEGVRLCRAGSWEPSLPVQTELTAAQPDRAIPWACLGHALHRAGRYREAIDAYGKGLALGALQPFRMMLEIAKSHLALGEKDAALDWLERAVKAGSPVRQRWKTDSDLAPLRDDPRFRAAALDIDVTGLSRAEGWRLDIATLSAEMKRLHYRPFGERSEALFDADIAAISRDVEKLDDHQVEVRLMRLLVLHGDGHTQLMPPWRWGAGLRIAPLPMELLPEGLVVTAVRPGDEALLWARVTEVGGRPVDEAIAAIRDVIPRDNEATIRSRVPYFLRFPQMLAPLGFSKDAGRATYTVLTREGERRTVEFEAVAPYTGEWVRRPPGHGKPLPAGLARQKENYWFEVRPEARLLHVQMNRVENAPGGETMAAFAKRLEAAIDRDDVRHVVVDLRANGGGNTDLLKSVLEAILGTRKTHRENGLFVITGRQTFSAAMNFAALLERNADPVFVGEPTGSRPNFIGEGSEVILPWSRARASISFLMWQNAQPQDSRTWIAPHLPAPPSLEDLVTGRDPAMEAILARLR